MLGSLAHEGIKPQRTNCPTRPVPGFCRMTGMLLCGAMFQRGKNSGHASSWKCSINLAALALREYLPHMLVKISQISLCQKAVHIVFRSVLKLGRVS